MRDYQRTQFVSLVIWLHNIIQLLVVFYGTMVQGSFDFMTPHSRGAQKVVHCRVKQL